MKKLLKNNLLVIIGVVLGGLGGFLYWYFIGCNSGTCPINSSPYLSTIWGMAIGGLLLSMFRVKPKENK
ncbi:MAG: DUF6132 family protein [Bacteroidales bacterium]|jgi:H+/Cl- antiporter ClcA